MSKKKPELNVGQTVYVSTTGFFSGNEPKEPTPYIITKTNTKSIYVTREGSSYEERFDKKTWTSNVILGDTKRMWLSTEDYWNSVKRSEDKKVLRSRIAGELSDLSLEQLQKIANMLKIKL